MCRTMLFGWITVLIGLTSSVSGRSCDWAGVGRGFYTYGPDCQYPCHCKNRGTKCNVDTGECGEPCEVGWTGPSCQYRNFALAKTISANHGDSHQKITDGYDTSCSYQTDPGYDPYVRVALENELYVKEINITFKNYTEVAGFSVYVGMTTEREQSTLCYTDTGDDVIENGNSVNVICPRRMLSRFVTVLLKGSSRRLEVCEITVVSGRLLSFHKTTNSSQTERPSEHAVNGDTRDFFGTVELSDPWWYVDLGDKFTIDYIEIHMRTNVKDFFLGAQVQIGDTLSEKEVIYRNMDTSNTIPDVVRIPVNERTARYVWVTIRGDKRRLHMSELSVFGSCKKHRCGVACSDMCFCKDRVRTRVNDYIGLCREGCERNWRSIDGYCNRSVCGPNNFGYECKYQCNCDGLCDPWTGKCLQEDNTCENHFYGPTCQAANFVRNSPSTIQGSGSTYQEAPVTVDGRINTCASVVNGQSPSWVVQIGPGRNVSNVIIYVDDSNTGSGFEVMLETDNEVSYCETVRTSTGQYLGRCRNMPATLLRLRTRSSMQICEVAVVDCLEGTFGPFCESTCLCYNSRPCNRVSGTCPAGGCESGYEGQNCETECTPGKYGHNCTSECGYCNSGAHCDIFTGDCALPCQSGWQGGKCDQECRNGTYGANCLKTCGFCLNGEPCDKASGVCLKGCAAGYYGDECYTECESGTYGLNCNMSCGNCSMEEVCDAIDGSCRSGCVIGLDPPLCQDVCHHGSYGKDCKLDCGDCRSNVTCDIITGVCANGCDAGVYVNDVPTMCNFACLGGRYGFNCTETCLEDICAGNDICDKKTGACLNGCLYPGFQPPHCTEDCWPGTYGGGCAHKCGSCYDKRPCNITTGHCPAGCDEGFVGVHCHDLDTSLSGVSIFLIVLVCLLVVFALLLAATAYWIYKKGTLPWAGVTLRRKEKLMREERGKRNLSIVSRVYENNLDLENENKKMKRSNSNDGGLSEAKPRGTISVNDFWDYVQDKKSSRNEMVQQFKDLAVGLTHPCEVAKKAQNLRKNRYKEIFAYDHARVKLDVLPGDTGNDYINACFISGYNRPHMYIAAQGPTEEFVADFWRMVWQKKCRKIVMLTRLVEHNKVKCCQYWPDEGEKMYGNVKVEVKDTDAFSDFSTRTFLISSEGKEGRIVKHFHFESWPDRHVPEYASSVVHFWSTIRHVDLKDNVPTLVQCSAGIGRTGTFLALDYLIDQAQAEGYVNVFQCAQNLRHQRVNMIQNQDQYVFLHEALVEALFCPSTAIPCERYNTTYKKMMELDPNTKKPKLELEYELGIANKLHHRIPSVLARHQDIMTAIDNSVYTGRGSIMRILKLQHVTKFSESMSSSFYDNGEYKAAKNSVNSDKNRTKNILPSDTHRPYLTSRVQDRNDYINAVFLPSYREDKAFLITQSPLPDTIVDFWRMVYENKVCTIVNLDRITNTSEIYWPVEGETVTFIPFQLHYVTEVDHVTHIERTIKLTNAEEPREKAMLVKQYECKFWMTDARVPTGGESSLLSVYEHAQKWQASNDNPPLVVHCNNGATKSGLFCVMTSTLERIKQERDVALQQTLKQMRINRHQIVPTFEQYKFGHDVIVEFLRGFDTFSNFYI